jgi:hypothetical protein
VQQPEGKVSPAAPPAPKEKEVIAVTVGGLFSKGVDGLFTGGPRVQLILLTSHVWRGLRFSGSIMHLEAGWEDHQQQS